LASYPKLKGPLQVFYFIYKNKLLWEGEKILRFDGSTASFEALHILGKNQLKKETSKFWLVVVKEGDSVHIRFGNMLSSGCIDGMNWPYVRE